MVRSVDFRILRNERGSVLAIGLLVLALLTIIGISATTTTMTDIQIAGNEKIQSMAFYAADAGIEAGRAALNALKVADGGNWDNLLSNTPFTWQDSDGNDVSVSTLNQVLNVAGGRSVGPENCTFALEIRDNNDLDGNNQVDTDDIIYLTSTGRYLSARVQIETQVRYSGGGDQYVQEHYGIDSSGVADRESGTVAAEQRW